MAKRKKEEIDPREELPKRIKGYFGETVGSSSQ